MILLLLQSSPCSACSSVGSSFSWRFWSSKINSGPANILRYKPCGTLPKTSALLKVHRRGDSDYHYVLTQRVNLQISEVEISVLFVKCLHKLGNHTVKKDKINCVNFLSAEIQFFPMEKRSKLPLPFNFNLSTFPVGKTNWWNHLLKALADWR